jgi:hypothetical protein
MEQLTPESSAPRAPSSAVLPLLQGANWKHIQLKLMEYALFKVARLSWRTPDGSLPRGLTAEDLVVQAIQKTFEGATASDSEKGPTAPGARHWNPQRQPNLLEFLKAVVDSDVSHLVNSEDHRVLKHFEPGDFERHAGAVSATSSAERQLIRGEEDRAHAAELDWIASIECEFDDDPEVLLILSSYRRQSEEEDQVKPQQVAEDTGLPIETVRNGIKRMRRKLFALRKTKAPEVRA